MPRSRLTIASLIASATLVASVIASFGFAIGWDKQDVRRQNQLLRQIIQTRTTARKSTYAPKTERRIAPHLRKMYARGGGAIPGENNSGMLSARPVFGGGDVPSRAEDVTRPTHVTKREARAPFMGDASARNQNYRLSSGNLTPIFSENLSAGVRMHKMRAGQRQHLQQTNIQLQQIIRNTRTSR
ncbi:MAG: hypothetical protein CL911_07180 [Deltaproteobacteria bacterium]|nr:hypothetical protein [Deltaproteobacteria bacterium]